jgi:hypothetical protein
VVLTNTGRSQALYHFHRYRHHHLCASFDMSQIRCGIEPKVDLNHWIISDVDILFQCEISRFGELLGGRAWTCRFSSLKKVSTGHSRMLVVLLLE